MPFALASLLGSCFLAWVVVLGGCAPDLNEALMRRVGQEVQFGDLQRTPPRQQTRQVVLEGRIAWLKPVDGLIVLEDTQLRLTESQNRPVLFARPSGNVIVTYRGLLDPAIYCLGRSVTVVGVVPERRAAPGQDAPELRRNPAIEAKRIDLGPDRPAVHSLAPAPSFLFSPDPFPPFHHNFDPFHRPFCD